MARDNPRDDSAPLLIGFVACALAGVIVVIWLGAAASPPVLAAAVALVAGLAALGAVGIGRLLRDEAAPATEAARGRTRRPPLLALLPAVLIPLVVTGSVLAAPRPQRTPIATVRDFLAAAVVDDNGEAACTYLTAAARVDFEGSGLRGPATWQSYFGGATLRLGEYTVTSDQLVDRLHYALAVVGSDRLVTVSHGGQAMRFLLQPANRVEQQAFAAPRTPWRIASSVTALGSH
jgi:hypothetical protein